MRNDDIKVFMADLLDKRDNLCIEHGGDIKDIKKELTEIKVTLAKIITAYKVFIGIGSAVGAIIGFFVQFIYKSI